MPRSRILSRFARSRTCVLVIAVALLATMAACGGDDDDDAGGPTTPTTVGSGPLAGVVVFEVDDRDHVEIGETVEYPVETHGNPPAWGRHWAPPGWADCGFYTSPVPNEATVHSLEHGVVWLAYDPALAPADLTALEAIAGEEKVVVSPAAGLSAPVVASAWGVQLAVTGPTDPALAAFIDEYVDSDGSPEPEGPCESGVLNPGNVTGV